MTLSGSKKTILFFILAAYVLALVLALDNVTERGALRTAFMLGVPTLLCAAAAYYVWRLRLRELLFVLIPAAGLIVVLEVGFSAYLALYPERAPGLLWGHGEDLGEYFAYRPHHYTLFTLKEGYRNDRGTVHNRQGFRNLKDLSTPKPSNEFRVFIVGGSSTYTVGIKDNRKIFSASLERALNREAAKRGSPLKIRVVNAGLGAATSAENLSRLIFLIHPHEPDLVIIQHGLNDVLPRLRGSIQSDYANFRRMWCGGTGREYDFFLKQWAYRHVIRNSRLLTFLCVRLNLLEPNTIRGAVTNDTFEERVENLDRNGPRFFQRNTELMVLAARHAGSDVILATCPFNERVGEARMRAMPQHNAVLEEVAERTKTALFDLHGAFDRSPEMLPDGLHVSREGSDLKARLYFEYLVEEYGIFGK